MGATVAYRKAIELGSKRPATRLNLGWALAESTGGAKEGLETFQTMQDMYGPSPDVLTGMAACLGKMGREQEAKAMFERILKEWPDYMAARYHYAKLLLTWKQGGAYHHGPPATTDPMGAINVLMPALKSEKGNTPIVLLMVQALEESDNSKAARNLLEAAIKDSPNDKRLQDALKRKVEPTPSSGLPPITIPEYTKDF